MGAIIEPRGVGGRVRQDPTDRLLCLPRERLAEPDRDSSERLRGPGSQGRRGLGRAERLPESRRGPRTRLAHRQSAGGHAGAGRQSARHDEEPHGRPGPGPGDDRHHAGLRGAGAADHRHPAGIQDRHARRLRPAAVRDLVEVRVPRRAATGVRGVLRPEGAGARHRGLRRALGVRPAAAVGGAGPL